MDILRAGKRALQQANIAYALRATESRKGFLVEGLHHFLGQPFHGFATYSASFFIAFGYFRINAREPSTAFSNSAS